MPIIRWRVVWDLEVMMDILSPTSKFISVDLPTLGLPTILTNPDLNAIIDFMCFDVDKTDVLLTKREQDAWI